MSEDDIVFIYPPSAGGSVRKGLNVVYQFGSVLRAFCLEGHSSYMYVEAHVVFSFFGVLSGFPLGLENLEKWEGIFQSGKSQGILIRLEKSGKSQGKSHKILEKSGNFRQILFIMLSDI